MQHKMKFQVKLTKINKNGYRIDVSNPVIICYGRNIKEVFNNLKLAFMKLKDLNQLEEFEEDVS